MFFETRDDVAWPSFLNDVGEMFFETRDDVAWPSFLNDVGDNDAHDSHLEDASVGSSTFFSMDQFSQFFPEQFREVSLLEYLGCGMCFPLSIMRELEEERNYLLKELEYTREVVQRMHAAQTASLEEIKDLQAERAMMQEVRDKDFKEIKVLKTERDLIRGALDAFLDPIRAKESLKAKESLNVMSKPRRSRIDTHQHRRKETIDTASNETADTESNETIDTESLSSVKPQTTRRRRKTVPRPRQRTVHW